MTVITAAQRPDFDLIVDLTPPGGRVLDVGCGAGGLLARLREEREAVARGLELNADRVAQCLAQGLSVIQGDADRDLGVYPDAGFDVVVLSRTIQATRSPRRVLTELARIGTKVVVSFPNYAWWGKRVRFLGQGRAPVDTADGEPWWSREAIHPCSIKDFIALADHVGLDTQAAYALSPTRAKPLKPRRLAGANWAAREAMFVLGRANKDLNT
ncbi:MAG: methionine biosynthesis protein MetW [Maricaulaceae bacterium]